MNKNLQEPRVMRLRLLWSGVFKQPGNSLGFDDSRSVRARRSRGNYRRRAGKDPAAHERLSPCNPHISRHEHTSASMQTLHGVYTRG